MFAENNWGLSPRTTELTAGYHPNNNPDKPLGFPMSFSEFCEYTNIRELTVKVIKEARPIQYKQYLRNQDFVAAQEYYLYLCFYQTDNRSQIPFVNLKIRNNCSENLRNLIYSFPKNVEDARRYPVSFEMFYNYTNCAELVEKHFKKCGRTYDPKSEESKKYAQRLYKHFYYNPENRQKSRIQAKPCPKSCREQLLKFPTDKPAYMERENVYTSTPQGNHLHEVSFHGEAKLSEEATNF